MSHELTPSYTDTEATIIRAVNPMRQLLLDENGRKLEDPLRISSEGGAFTLGYEDASFEWNKPRLLVEVSAEADHARGIYIIDCRSKDFEDTPILTVTKFDQQLKSVRNADEAELDDIAKLVSGVDDAFVDSILEKRRAQNKRSGLGSAIASLFSRNR